VLLGAASSAGPERCQGSGTRTGRRLTITRRETSSRCWLGRGGVKSGNSYGKDGRFRILCVRDQENGVQHPRFARQRSCNYTGGLDHLRLTTDTLGRDFRLTDVGAATWWRNIHCLTQNIRENTLTQSFASPRPVGCCWRCFGGLAILVHTTLRPRRSVDRPCPIETETFSADAFAEGLFVVGVLLETYAFDAIAGRMVGRSTWTLGSGCYAGVSDLERIGDCVEGFVGGFTALLQLDCCSGLGESVA